MKKQIKVAYYPSDTPKVKVLGSNGKSLDRLCVKCDTEEDTSSGNYILDARFLTEKSLNELLQEEAILKVLMDYGTEVFRISKVIKGTRYTDIVARQITIADSLTLWLEDVRPTNLSGAAAANYLTTNSTGVKDIEVVSDIQGSSTAYYQRMSLYKALHDSEQSFQNRWGGEILRRGYTVYMNSRIGTDRGFSIREGKNLTGFECSSNIDSLVTRARGKGFDGILGNYIDSPLINNYRSIYTGVIGYEDVKVKDENSDEGYDTLEQAQAELDRRIREEFSKNDIDKIKASYNINFVQLEKTEEYKNYVQAERAYIGDTLRVYIPKLDTDIKVRAINKKFDVLAQRTKEIKLSNYIEAKPLTIKEIAKRLESIDSTDSILQQAKDNASALIKGGLKNSYVVVRENEIVIGDTKDINTMTNVWRFNNGGLGHSKTGYYGEFGTAITQDGQIVADFITTGTLSANLIKAGLLQDSLGKNTINMENGTFSLGGGKITYDGSNLNINAEAVKLAMGQIGGNNLFLDGSFELGYNIARVGGAFPSLQIEANVTGVHLPYEGKYFFFAQGITNSKYAYVNFAQLIPLIGGRKYTTSFFYKRDSVAPILANRTSLIYLDSNGAYITEHILNAENSKFNVTTYVAPPGTAGAYIRFGYELAYPDYSWIYVDAVKIEEGDNATAFSGHQSEMKGTTYTFDGESFKIGSNANGNVAEHTPNYSKYIHGSGANTVVDYEGFKIFNPSGVKTLGTASDGSMLMRGILEQYSASTGYKGMEIKGNTLNIFDWTRDGDYVGSLGSTVDQNGRGSIMLYGDKGNPLKLGWHSQDGSQYPLRSCMIIDDTTVENKGIAKVGFYESIAMINSAINIVSDGVLIGKLHMSSNNNVHLLGRQNVGHPRIGEIVPDGSYSSMAKFETAGSYIWGNFACSGTKSRIVETENYGARSLNAYETPEPYFGDIGEAVLDENGECIIYIDPIFAETIDNKAKYQVFTQVYEGSITSIKRYGTYFIVKGEPGTEFAWELKAKQKGYTDIRLEEREIKTEETGQKDIATEGLLLDTLNLNDLSPVADILEVPLEEIKLL